MSDSEKPRSEPEIIPPGRAGRGATPRERVSVDTQGAERIYVTRIRPLSGILTMLLTRIVLAVMLALFFGAMPYDRRHLAGSHQPTGDVGSRAADRRPAQPANPRRSDRSHHQRLGSLSDRSPIFLALPPRRVTFLTSLSVFCGKCRTPTPSRFLLVSELQ